MQISNTPPKGTSDWFPEEYKVRKYIFDTWRKVCLSYGFEEYLGPLVENIEIWKAKSGEDVGGSELTRLTDREGKVSDLALRPEMTPTVTRMITRKWKEIEKPVKWFSIANFYRNEKPQKGRNREFWQLNADIFGENSQYCDSEILTLSLELMRAFHAPKGSYTLKLNHRELINSFFDIVLEITDDNEKRDVMRLLDKYEKLSREAFAKELKKLGQESELDVIVKFMSINTLSELQTQFVSLAGSEGFKNFEAIIHTLESLGYGWEIEFSWNLIRGFDYYDGIIFEMFDNNPDNPRALFGGGRYNGLANIFGVKEDIPAIGFAPGDETMKLFLEGHGMLDDILKTQEELYYIPLLDEAYFTDIQNIAHTLRSQGKNVLSALSTKKLGKALQYANKKWFSHIVILGEQEKLSGKCVLKDLKTGEEENISLS